MGYCNTCKILIVNEKFTILVVLQVICDMDKLFWNVCCSVPSTTTNEGQFKVSFIYEQFRTQSILKESIVVVEGLEKSCSTNKWMLV